MTARRRAGILTAREFDVLRGNSLVDKRRLVANVEAAFRRAIGAEDLDDDAIVAATLDRRGQTAAERAGLAVVRLCIACREAPEGDAALWLDRLVLALAQAHPTMVAGVELHERQRKHGKASGAARDPRTKHAGLAKLIRLAIRRGEKPRSYVAEWCDEYGIGRSALYALIRRIEAE